MRILLINQYYPPDASSTAYLVGELAEDLARHHDVVVVAGRPSYDPDVTTYRPQGPRVERARSTGFDRARMTGRLLNYGSFVLGALIRVLTVPKPDVVVAFTDPPVIGAIGALAARRHRVPFAYVCWDIFPDAALALRGADAPVLVSVWRKLNRWVRDEADLVVAIGRDMREKLESEGVPSRKIEILPNWALDPPADPDLVARTRASMGWEDRFVVMHGGNVGLAQNLGMVIAAAHHLRGRPGILFAIVGDGVARAGLQREVARRDLSNVTFVPRRPKSDAQALMASADLHVISLVPGLWGCVVPSKVYGVLAHGLPFVAAVEEGSEVARIAKETGAGVRIDPGDSRELAGAVERFADGVEDVRAAGSAARAEFEARYARTIGTDRYRRALESLVERRREARAGSAPASRASS